MGGILPYQRARESMVRDQAASLIALELGINVHADGLLKERTFLSSVHSFIAIVREGQAPDTIRACGL